MEVFISWSGKRSKALAIVLRGWLPHALRYVKPWVSEKDIAAGSRWGPEVAKHLEDSKFGIICLTPENIEMPWVLFEAGALAKKMDDALVPLLFDLELSDITPPLSQFQAKKVENKSDFLEVVQSINQKSEQAFPKEQVEGLFNDLWPGFEKRLEDIPVDSTAEKRERPHGEILEDLVAGVRGLDSRFKDLEIEVSDKNHKLQRGRKRFIKPGMAVELISGMSRLFKDPTVILEWACLMRDENPWLYEVMVRAYFEIRDGDLISRKEMLERLLANIQEINFSSFIQKYGGLSEDARMTMTFFGDELGRYLLKIDVHGDRVISIPDPPDSEEVTE